MPRDKRLYMTFPIDFWTHPKVSRLSDAAFRAFVESNGHSRMIESDGRIEAEDAEFMWKPEILAELLRSHPTRPLMLREGDAYVLRDYAQHQFTKADRDGLSERRREAGKAGAAKRWGGIANAKHTVTGAMQDDGKAWLEKGIGTGESNKNSAHPSDSPSTQMINQMFDSFWQAWPVKKGKEPARKSFVKALKAGADIKAIMAGVEAYKSELGPIMGGKTVDGRTPKYAQGWLTDKRWEDEPSSASTDAINAQWDAAIADHKPDPCANGHKWAADGSCVRFPCPAERNGS